MEIMLQDKRNQVEFSEAYEELKNEHQERGQMLWTIDDASAFVLRTKDAYAKNELSCIAVLSGPKRTASELVSFSWRPEQ